MPSLRALVPVLCLAVLGGCSSKEKKCEHARDVMVGVMEEHAKKAMAGATPQERAKFEGQIEAELDHARSAFVGECAKLDDAGMDCIARIDEVLAAQKRIDAAAQKAEAECPKDEIGLTDLDCVDKARDAAEAKEKAAFEGPDCEAALGALAERIHAGGPKPEPGAAPDPG